MRVIERQGSREDGHFTEGEPDLEPPEELAVLEVDEEALLEEDLDSRADLEEEVDEDVLETSLDHLVHDGDDEEDDAEAGTVVAGDGDTAVVEDLEIEDLEDRDESLDRILRVMLAGDEEPADDVDEGGGADAPADAAATVASCGPDEFVCPSCFLVRHRALRAGGSGSVCHDCAE